MSGTEAAPPAPPAYTADANEESELRLIPSETNALQFQTGSDILGVRTQILANASVLFTFCWGKHRKIPSDFRVVTSKESRASGRPDAGKSYAYVLYGHEVPKSSTRSLGMFMMGPAADSTELALRGLLETMEEMLGRRWRSALDAGLVGKFSGYFIKNDAR